MKVTVLGAAGGIGQPLSLILKNNLPAGSSLSLYDVNPATPGVAKDLSHIPTDVTVEGFAGKDATPALVGTDVVVIPAGVARKPGMTRDDLFNINASIVRDLVTTIGKTAPDAVIAIITNPVNSMVPLAAEVLTPAIQFYLCCHRFLKPQILIRKPLNSLLQEFRMPVLKLLKQKPVLVLPLYQWQLPVHVWFFLLLKQKWVNLVLLNALMYRVVLSMLISWLSRFVSVWMELKNIFHWVT